MFIQISVLEKTKASFPPIVEVRWHIKRLLQGTTWSWSSF